ncbi:MAG: tRNA (adenosine(37)-N6)-threonylcarbamoyltransferase complex dimerization subunit type 1 TsaB [Xanthomonadales bacterium]|nr:tRNA (adenosine(37)-N6)-threonylcarbamoyltransferase complex dimerization subunit type 1 TsaB [Xanthomonadales bacterium]
MNLLAIETATETCSVALSAGDEVRERYRHAPRKHAELLLPWVQQLMAEAGLGFSSLDAIAFSRGPGSFTSLRIGIGVVQGLAWASGCPVIPVSSLAATAQSAANEGIGSALVALDARMDEVFTGAFAVNDRGVMTPTVDERVCSPVDVPLPTRAGTVGVGVGFARYAALEKLSTQLDGVRTDLWPRASTVITLAQEWLRDNEALPAEQAQPVYLRDNVAKKSR